MRLLTTSSFYHLSIENGWADLASIFFRFFVIAVEMFLQMKILRNDSGKVAEFEKSKDDFLK